MPITTPARALGRFCELCVDEFPAIASELHEAARRLETPRTAGQLRLLGAGVAGLLRKAGAGFVLEETARRIVA